MRAAKPTLSDRVARAEQGSGVGRAATMIAAATAAALLSAAAYLYVTPPQFTAVSKLVLERVGGPTSRSVDSFDAFLATQADVMRSSEVLRLADADSSLGALASLAGQRDPLPAIRRSLRIDVAGNGGVLTVAYPSANVEDAKRIVDAIVRAYVSYQSDKRRERVASLTRDADIARQPIAEEVARLARATSDAEASVAGRGAADAIAQRVRSSVDVLVQAQAAVVDTRRAYDEAVADAGPLLSKLSDDDLDRAIRNAAVTGGETAERVTERLELAVRQLAELRRTYAENHPAVLRLRVQIDRLRVERVAAARRSWQSATVRQTEAKATADRASAEANGLASVVDERDRRRADLARAQARLADADRQLDVARGVTSGTMLDIEVLTHADAGDPKYPPTPRPLPTLAIALLAGLGVGATLATVGEYRRAGTLRHVAPRRGNGDSAEARLAREAFGLRVLGSVPELASSGQDQAAKLRGDPSAPLARAADAARAQIVAEGFDRGTLAVTSQRDGEGRSTIARAIAAAMARAGGRVLLVEADGGDADSAPGFADALIDGDVETKWKPSTAANLFTLPAGRAHADFDLFINSPRLPELLVACGEAFDQVILDCASLSAGDTARIIAASTDAAFLVSDGAVASLRRAASGRDVLQLVGARVLGVVINRVRHSVEPNHVGDRAAD